MKSSEHFKKISKIGHGGMAEVYKAEVDHSGIKKTVALKQILSTFSNISHFKENFRYEAMLAMELNHPNIVQVFDYGQTSEGLLYMMMEYVDGLDLMTLMKKTKEDKKLLPQGIAVHIVIEILKALDYAHKLKGPDGTPRKLVHRDISPQNILLSYEGAVKVTDFGIAKAAGKDEETGVLKGKLQYMSPEQAKAEDVDGRSDIFSTGLILYEMITGENPYRSYKGKGEKALEAVRKAEIPPPSRYVDLDVELEQIINKSLAPSKEKRYQRARDMQIALGKYLHSLPELYDTTALADLIDEYFPHQPEQPAKHGATSVYTHTMEFSTMHGEFGDTSDLLGSYSESKSLVMMKVCILGADQAYKTHDKQKIDRILNSIAEMIQDITVLKDKQRRYSFKRNSPTELEIIRGIPYTGEYDETEVLLDAHRIRDAFQNYREDIEELNIGIAVYRASVNIIQDRNNLECDVTPQDAENIKQMAHVLPGEIIISPFIHVAAKYNWEFEKLGDQDHLSKQSLEIIKHLEEKEISPLYRLIRQKSQVEQRKTRIYDEFVGRKSESERLKQIFHTIRMGDKARSVALMGEMGIGKTALVQNFVRNLAVETEVITTEARPYYKNTPFNFILGLIYDFTGINPNIETGRNINVEDVLSSRIQSPQVAGLIKTAISKIFQKADGGVTKNQNILKLVSQAISELLSMLSAKKAVIAVFEDLQWADEQSKLILNDLLTQYHFKGKVLFILSGREPEHFEHLNISSVIKLKPLSDKEIFNLLNLRFLNDEKTSKLVKLITTQADGNPFVINEIVATLQDFGYVEETDGKLKLIKEIKDDPMFLHSPTVEGLVSSRLDALPTHSKYIIRLASVMGKHFSKEILNALLQKDDLFSFTKDNSLENILESLVKKQIIIETHKDSYQFVQQFVRDYAYKATPPEIRQKAHLAIADHLSKKDFHPLQGAPLIASHYEQGGNKEKAIEYYFIAGHAARRLSSNREAEKLYRKVLELAENNPDLVENTHHAYKDLEIIYRSLGKRNEQIAMIELLKEQAIKFNKIKWQVEALCKEMAYHQDTGNPHKTVEMFKNTFELAQKIDDAALQATALKVLARAKVDLGKIDKAYAYTSQGLEIIKKEIEQASSELTEDKIYKLERTKAELLHVRGNVLFYKGQIEDSSKVYEEALNIFKKLEIRTSESTIEMNLGFISAMQGNFLKALKHYKKSYEMDLQSGDRIHTGMKQANIAHVHIDLGYYEDAEKMIRKAIHLCETTKDIGGLSDSILTYALLRIRQKQYNHAMKYIKKGIAYAKQADSILDEIRGRILWATCQLEDPYGSLEEAETQSGKAIELSQQAQAPSEWVHSLSLQALTLNKTGNTQLAYEKSVQALALSTVTFVPLMETVFHTHAVIMMSMGEMWWAAQYIRKAYDIIKRKASNLSVTGGDSQISSNNLKEKYLSVKPAVSIIESYNRISEEANM